MADDGYRPKGNEARYAVAAEPEAGLPGARYAIFLTHGMGQPLPFQTIDGVAESLRKLDVERHEDNPKPIARTIRSGDQWLTRLEIRLGSKVGGVEVHLYEAYWAPLTEGRIKARNVLGFLAGAGLNGVRNATGNFRRWMFDRYQPFPVPVRMVFFLLIGVLTVGALAVMNSAIALVVGARVVLGERAAWLTDNLFVDLTTTFNLVVSALAAFALSLGIAVALRQIDRWRGVRRAWSVVTVVLFVAALVVVVLSGFGIPPLVYGHVRDLAGPAPLWNTLASPGFVVWLNREFDRIALDGVTWVAGILALLWTWKIVAGLRRDLENEDGAGITTAVALGFFLLIVFLTALAGFFVNAYRDRFFSTPRDVPLGVAWPLLVIASYYVRLLLVQFVGDVAIYIMPYKLDAFNDLRQEIKQRAYKVAKGVYEQAGYDSVIVVGHSLGSVIAYDALNMLILEDEAARAQAGDAVSAPEVGPRVKGDLGVARRTPLFLTFGSPLDKTAFVFAVQPKGTSEAREALAGSVQPMIQSYDRRPAKWINIWSPWDIISGPLDLYDLPRKEHSFPAGTIRQRVHNIHDRDATTLLVAHVEYWKNKALVETIYDEMIALSPSAPRP